MGSKSKSGSASTLNHSGKESGRDGSRSSSLSVHKTYKLYINGCFSRTESGRYFKLERDESSIADISRASRKDLREAVVAARRAQKKWADSSAYLKGQILYRVAEMLEGRRQQFVDELSTQGLSSEQAKQDVNQSIDCLVHYAGWSDKYQQVASSVNPVASSHFNFSMPEATGVVALLAPQAHGLVGLVANIAPIIVGGNTVVALASATYPLCAISFAEVLHTADVPAGVVNLLTGFEDELVEPFATHMDVNALIYCGDSEEKILQIESLAACNVKRVTLRPQLITMGPHTIMDTQELKTTWHPVGG